MNNRHLLYGFALCMTGLLALGSCGVNKVSEEEGMQALNSIKSAYLEDKVETPKEITITKKEKGTNLLGKYSKEFIFSINYNAYVAYMYTSESNKEKNTVSEGWIYCEDDFLYSVDKDDKEKTYTKQKITLSQLDYYFKENPIFNRFLDTISEKSLVVADEIIKSAKLHEDENYLKEHYANGKLSHNTTYRTHGEGSFGVDFDLTMKDVCVLDIAMVLSGTYSSSILFESNILSHYETNNVFTYNSESMKKYSSIDITFATKFEKPNIDGFIQEEA